MVRDLKGKKDEIARLKEELFYKQVELEKLKGRLEETIRALKLHDNIIISLASSTVLQKDLDNLLDSIKRLYKLDEIAVLLYDDETGLLYVFSAAGLTEERRSKTFLPGEGVSGEAFKEGKIIEVERAGSDPRFRFWGVPSDKYRNKAFIATPLIVGHVKLGVISVTADAITTGIKNAIIVLANTLIPLLSIKIEKEKQEHVFFEILTHVLDLVESMNPFFKGHSQRVYRYARYLAEKLRVSREEIEIISKGALLHDIGKVGLMDLAAKKGRLTRKEMERMKEHPLIGESFIKNFEFLHDTIPIIKYHHERIDGKGYPGELKGNEIPLLVKIVSVADVYDAITSERPYKKSMPLKYAIRELRRVKGTQLDSRLVESFVRDYEDLKEYTITLRTLY